MKMNNTRGSILIVALWIVTLFVVMVLSLAFRSHFEAKITLRANQAFAARIMCFSAIDIARYFIDSDEQPTVDSVFDPWYGDCVLDEDVWNDAGIKIAICDEEGKMNINRASEKQLTLLCEYLDDEGYDFNASIDDVVAAIMQWRGDTPLQGSRIHAKDLKGAPFESLQELYFLSEYFSIDLAYLSQYVSVYAHADKEGLHMNPNTASPLVLRSLVMSLAGDERVKESIADALLVFCEERDALRDVREEYEETETAAVDEEDERDDKQNRSFLDENDISPYTLLDRLHLTGDVRTVSLVIQLVRYFNLDSKTFSVKVVPVIAESTYPSVQFYLGPKDGPCENETLSVLEWCED